MQAVSVVGDDLRETSDGPRLVGGRCRACGAVAFPRPASCARCTGSDVDEHLLADRGSLWTFTVQNFLPKAPYDGWAEFTPYGVGYVELDGEVLVESRLLASSAAGLRIGAAVHLVVEEYGADASGTPLTTFAFAVDGAPA
ncbi:Zn-ribbon domain-containing OB-fold protein [Nocardioides zeae]|uniref:DNA-binding protein n=1 Tax=Nocardioides zeae TaxID=1457234 RepID=A0A6P0HKE3_9ACTN|nr:OB-fold domain-containing protein [Nocardioides zeae]NEN79148.1 DNA-binding protein [Nocardioides zeae]